MKSDFFFSAVAEQKTAFQAPRRVAHEVSSAIFKPFHSSFLLGTSGFVAKGRLLRRRLVSDQVILVPFINVAAKMNRLLRVDPCGPVDDTNGNALG